MKFIFLVCFLMLAVFSSAKPPEHSRGCIYIDGKCFKECEEGTHSYTTGCGYLTPEATCAQPYPKLDKGGEVCDYSECYCDEPTVRDTVSGKCVTLDKCSKKN